MDEIDYEFLSAHDLVFSSIIARGGYGIVYKVYSNRYKEDFALKRIPEARFKENEVECMKIIQSPHIVNLYNYYHFKDNVYMLMEYCPMCLAQMLMRYGGPMPYDELIKFSREILLAIKSCHDIQMAHSDIKPSNFLIDRYGRVKACDFGLSSVWTENATSSHFKGSCLFMAPEIFNHCPFDPFKTDIWAIGVTFYFMATHDYPFDSQVSKADLIQIIRQGFFNSDNIEDTEFRYLIVRMLDLDPTKRPSIDEILNMPIFKNSFMPKQLSLSSKISKAASTSIIQLKTLKCSRHIKTSKPNLFHCVAESMPKISIPHKITAHRLL